MNKTDCVIDTEPLIWQGRPAPRCYTFRHWRKVLCWAWVLLLAVIWQIWMWHIWSAQEAWGRVFSPIPLLMTALYLSGGRLVRARLEWEHLFYHLSDTALIIQQGAKKRFTRYPLAQLTEVRLEWYRENATSDLGWVYVRFGADHVVLACLEDARKVHTILAQHLQSCAGTHKRGNSKTLL